ncbi:MAG: glycoside hydrolase family 9 protein [Ruminococcus sp.]|nr:glycoside hydrolase family 9 protein [Ruminococcus sp.]
MKKKHIFRHFTASIAACTLMISAIPAIPFAVSAADNIITNSTFDKDTTDWGMYKESGGAATLTTDDGKLALTVTNQGKVNYAVQMFYDIIPLYQNGVYRLKFDISATVPRYVEAMIQQNGGTYQAYTWKGIDVTTESQTIDYEFTMEKETDIMSKLCFNCGIQKTDGELPEHTIYLDNVSLELIDDSEVDYGATAGYEAHIITNQIGYRPDAKKTAVFRHTEGGEFSVVNAETEEVVYTGNMEGPKNNIQADETNYTGDFSEVKTAGKYYIKSDGLDNSYTFEIGEDVYNNLLDSTVKMLYLQRCGTEINDDEFSHTSCHDTVATIYGTDEQIEVNGGWHDAGDYGRYIVAGAKAVADLLYAYKANPEIYNDNIGIPESGNGTADILDEVRYELEWMMKMQDTDDGGVYHKVTCDTFPGYVMPEKETKPLIVMPKSTTATADFAASIALAYEVYKDIDTDFADKCLDAAKKAYDWTKENPNVTYKNPDDIVTGEYGDNITSDERYWASVQMYRATGDESYIENISVTTGLDWSTVGDYGNIAILTMKDIDKTSDIYKKALSAVKKQADNFISVSNVMPYGVALTKYNWGSNMTIANAGIILGIMYNETGDSKYLDAANAQLDYLLGSNPLGTSFVTGFGTVSPENPHHRPSMAVGKAMSGMLVGGVNSNLEDSAAKAYCKYSAPAKCWVDNAESYSTNEITIYWNSPLTYLLTLTDSAQNISNEDLKVTLLGDANCDGILTIADATAIVQALGNPDEYALSKQGEINADCYNTGDGVTGRDAVSIQKIEAGLITSLPESTIIEDDTELNHSSET